MLPSRHGSEHIKGPVLSGGYHHHSSGLFILKCCWKKIQQEEAASLILFLSNQNGALPIKIREQKQHPWMFVQVQAAQSCGPKGSQLGGRGCDLVLLYVPTLFQSVCEGYV